MYDEPGRLGQPPRKSRTADSIIFEKEDDFRTTFVSAVGQSACRLTHEWLHLIMHMYIYMNIKIFFIITT